MPLNANALTTLDNVRAMLQVQVDDVDADALLTDLINRASDAIIRHTGREFAPVSTNATRTFVYDGSGFLDLAPYDLQTTPAPTVVMDVDGTSPTTLASTDYKLRPKPAINSVYWGLVLPVRYCETEVSVTGTWGFPSVPPQVEDACIRAVIHSFRAYSAGYSDAYSTDETNVRSTPLTLPPAVGRLLADFRRIKVG